MSNAGSGIPMIVNEEVDEDIISSDEDDSQGGTTAFDDDFFLTQKRSDELGVDEKLMQRKPSLSDSYVVRSLNKYDLKPSGDELIE